MVDLAAERRLAEWISAEAARPERVITSAHDLSDGGLAQALVESCLIGGFGARVELPADLDPFVALFSESSARALVTVPAAHADAVAERANVAGVTLRRLGEVTERDEDLALDGLGGISSATLREAWRGTLPGLFEN
jgi:phosphoribosylformylglycinamidine synthase subunit PurL